jgi:phosphatidylinositol-3-phosphatase
VRRPLLAVVALALAAGGIIAAVVVRASDDRSGSSSQTTNASPPRASEVDFCGGLSKPPRRWRHVVWVWLENHSYGEVLGPPGSDADRTMPYLNAVARSCGTANAYYSLVHPSLPNYLAVVSGGTQGVTNDCAPDACPLNVRTIFDQLTATGREWRTYAQTMPRPCAGDPSGLYTPTHNPAVYFRRIAPDCARWDVPLRTVGDSPLLREPLPALTLVVPDLCFDAHSCPLPKADSWLRTWIPKITSGTDYDAGSTAIIVTWDEGDGGEAGDKCRKFNGSCHIPTVVISPSTEPGTFVKSYFDHYSLLKTTEEMLGLPLLGHAADPQTRSMRAAFRL